MEPDGKRYPFLSVVAATLKKAPSYAGVRASISVARGNVRFFTTSVLLSSGALPVC